MFDAILVAIGEELIPIVRIILLIPLGKVHNIQNPTLQVDFQFLELDVELTTSFILDVVIELIALHHFLLILYYNLLENPLDVFLLLFSFVRRVFSVCWSFVALRLRLDWLISVEEGKHFRHVIDIYCSEEGAIVVFELFLSFLDELFTGVPE